MSEKAKQQGWQPTIAECPHGWDEASDPLEPIWGCWTCLEREGVPPFGPNLTDEYRANGVSLQSA